MTNECTSVVGHFDGHSSAPKQYRRHCPMRHVQDYPGSHWMLQPGNYLLHIAPAAAGATANETSMKNGPTLLAILMDVAVHRYNTACISQWRRSRAAQEATGCRPWASIMSNNIKGTYLRRFLSMFFIANTLKMGA